MPRSNRSTAAAKQDMDLQELMLSRSDANLNIRLPKKARQRIVDAWLQERLTTKRDVSLTSFVLMRVFQGGGSWLK